MDDDLTTIAKDTRRVAKDARSAISAHRLQTRQACSGTGGSAGGILPRAPRLRHHRPGITHCIAGM